MEKIGKRFIKEKPVSPLLISAGNPDKDAVLVIT